MDPVVLRPLGERGAHDVSNIPPSVLTPEEPTEEPRVALIPLSVGCEGHLVVRSPLRAPNSEARISHAQTNEAEGGERCEHLEGSEPGLVVGSKPLKPDLRLMLV